MKYNPLVVSGFFESYGLAPPEFEYRFHSSRKWRFDIAWPEDRIAIECDGGIWIAGGHNRGAQIKRDWEKRNIATGMGWRILYCEPCDLCKAEMAELVKATIGAIY